jgi:type I restriction enzyme S subunit
MTNPLPRGWTLALVDDVTSDVRSGFASGNKNVHGGISQLRMNNIGVGGELVLDIVRSVPPDLAKPNYSLNPGDVLVCTTNSTKLVGKCAFFDLMDRYVFSNHLTRLRPVPQLVDGKFLRWNLWVLWQSGFFDEKCKNWVNQSTLPKEDLLNTPVLIPPLNEQLRIVTKLEKLLDKVNSCQKRLAKVTILVKRFRQAVLAAACSGRLTADWREERDSEYEWPIRRLSEVGDITGGVTKNAKRQQMTLQMPYLRVANVYENRLKLNEVLKIGVTVHEWERTRLVKDDLLFVEGNGSLDQIGRVALWDGSIAKCVHQNHIIKFRASRDAIPKYVLLQMMGPEGRSQLIEKASSSAGLNTLSISKISEVNLPLPLLAEQQEIVRRVDELFALADQVEARYAKAKQYVDGLKQSILAKAFRGELVLQDPNEEPGTLLIERIREARGTKPRLP